MTMRSRRLRGVTHSVAAAAILAIAAGCGGSAGGSARPTPGAVASGPAASSAASPAGTPVAQGTALEVRDFTLQPLSLTVSDTNVVLDVHNAGPTVHNVTIRDDAGTVLGFTRDLRESESETVSAELAAGTYTLFCSLPGHESLGIKGSLTVKGS